MGLNIPPSIWQSYINAILDCLQNRKYCEAIMDDLLLFYTIKEVLYGQTQRFIKSAIKELVKDLSEEMSLVQNQFTMHG